MADEQSVQGVTYENVGADYFEKRGLRRYAGVWSLWALGVGAVISGDFFGWNFGLTSGGFGGLLIATLIITVMYLGLCYSIAEMSPALPHTGGAYSFARSAMGPWGGFLTGLGENIEYVLTPAVIVVGVGGYLGAIFGTAGCQRRPGGRCPTSIFVGLNIWGVEVSFRFTILITFLALAILLVFFIGALPYFDLSKWALNIGLDPQGAAVALPDGGGPWLPKGWFGIAAALPFAIWFYLAIEQLPLAAEEAHAPQRDMPKGMLLGILTLIIAAFLTLFLNSAIAPGAFEVGALDAAAAPRPQHHLRRRHRQQGARADRGRRPDRELPHDHLRLRPQHLLAVARGYFPHWLSLTHGQRKTPHVALIVGAVIGFVSPHDLVFLRAAGRRRAAEHGGVRGRDLLRHAGPLVSSSCARTCPTSRGPTSAPWACRGPGRR